MANDALWSEMVDVLKDIAHYLEKQDATQEKATLDKPPKTGEGQSKQDPIVGGPASQGKPGEGVAKSMPGLTGGEESTLLNAADEAPGLEDEDSAGAESFPSETSDEFEELKSLLKDIKSALVKQADVNAQVQKEIKKQMPSIIKSETERLLRKMGFHPATPDIVRLGIDQTGEVKKSEDKIEKSEDSKAQEAVKMVEDLSRRPWHELGKIREDLGGFNPFPGR